MPRATRLRVAVVVERDDLAPARSSRALEGRRACACEVSWRPWPVPSCASAALALLRWRGAAPIAADAGRSAPAARGFLRKSATPITPTSSGPPGARGVGVGQRGEVERRGLRQALAPAVDVDARRAARARSRSACGAAVWPVITLTPSTDTTASRSSPARLRSADLVLVAGLADDVGAALVPVHRQPLAFGAVVDREVRQPAVRAALARQRAMSLQQTTFRAFSCLSPFVSGHRSETESRRRKG